MGYLEGFKVPIFADGPQSSGSPCRTRRTKAPKPERLHGRHVLNRYEDGMEKCIGCELCAGVCPARCIYVRGADNPDDDPVSPGERYGFVYEINYLRCIHCDLCVEACPTEAITESKLFEFSFTNRQDAIYTKAELARRRRRPAPAPAVGGLARRARTSTPRPGCGPPRRRATPPSRAGSRGRASSATACGAPEQGQAHEDACAVHERPTTRWTADGDVEHTHDRPTPRRGALSRGNRHLHRLRGRSSLVGALGVVLSRNPVHSALSLVATLFGVAVLFLNQNAQLPGRRAGHRLHRRHRRAHPVRASCCSASTSEEDLRDRPDRRPAILAAIAGLGPARARCSSVFIRAASRLVTGQRSADRGAVAPTVSEHRPAGPHHLHQLSSPSRSPPVLLIIAVVGAVVWPAGPIATSRCPSPSRSTTTARRGAGDDADPRRRSTRCRRRGTSCSAPCCSPSAPSACSSGATRS